MKNTQKGFAKIWFIFGLVIIAVISFVIVKQGCWIVGKFYFKSTCESTSYSTQNETANWKTYRNNEYGFEFKYPKDYVIKSDTNTISIGNDNYASLYVISLTNNVSNISPDKYIEELRQKGVEEHYAPIVSSSKKIAVNNVNGIDAVLVAAMGVPERNIFLPLKDKLLNFSYFLGESANYVLEEYFRGNQNEFEQYLKNGDFILSTFKFTNSQQNTNVEAQMRTAVEKVLAEGKLPNPSLVMPKGIRQSCNFRF